MSKDTITLDLFPVTIRRSKNEEIAGLFPKHEIAILKAVHRGKVDVGKTPADDREYTVSAEGEFARLLKAYHRVNAPNPVPGVFLNGPEDLEPFGFQSGREDLAQGAESLSVDHKAAAKVAAKAEADKKKAGEAAAEKAGK